MPAPEGYESRRVAIYRELIFNNMSETLSRAFPVLKAIMPLSNWNGLVRDFLRDFRAKTPYFLRIAGEFVEYLESVRIPAEQDYPFLAELAHYEWTELSLSLEPEVASLDSSPDVDVLDGVPEISPVAWLGSYRYPVHRIGVTYVPEHAPETPSFLLIYRDDAFAIRFLELQPLAAHLYERIAQSPGETTIGIVKRIAAEIPGMSEDLLVNSATTTLRDWQKRGILRVMR